MRASKAREIAEGAGKPNIFMRIRTVAREGEFNLFVSKLSDEEVSKLRELGYSVDFDRYEKCWYISWMFAEPESPIRDAMAENQSSEI